MPSNKLRYEDCSEIIDQNIEKFRYKWKLQLLAWMDFDDVAQDFRLHIFKKWPTYQQDRPLGPWLSAVIHNLLINKMRDHYFNYAKPCSRCPFASGENACSWEGNETKIQCNVCPVFSRWEKRRKSQHDIKLPVSAEHHEIEINSVPTNDINLLAHFKKINKHARRYLTRLEYKIYRMLYVKKTSEEEVAKMLGFKTSEKYRKAGYRQLNNYKAQIVKKIRLIIDREDILGS